MPEKYLELYESNIIVERDIFWQDRYLMGNFINRTINGKKLCDGVDSLRRKLIDSCQKFNWKLGSEKLKDFQPDGRSKKFSGFLTSLYSECESFDEDYENEGFYTCIKNKFLKF
jgi:hypothetical protein